MAGVTATMSMSGAAEYCDAQAKKCERVEQQLGTLANQLEALETEVVKVRTAIRGGKLLTEVAQREVENAGGHYDQTIKASIDNALDKIKNELSPLIESAKKIEQRANSIRFEEAPKSSCTIF